MSDIQDLRGNIELKKIEAPSLTQSNYGKNIREKFDNIDDNLRRLANREFVAGKAGKDIKFAKYSLWSDNDFTDLGKVFVQAIVGDEPIDWNNDWNASTLDFTEEFYDNHKILSPVSVQGDTKVKFFEYFIENPDITIMYQLDDHEAPDEEANRILICSPYVYTFIDQRYAVLGNYTPSNPNVYSGLEDISCLLNLTYDGENPQLERINQFPTLYYDGNGQFRWKLYGSESGILATGPKGTDASSAPITFARLNSSSTGDNTATELSASTISQILVIDGSTAQWTDVTEVAEDKIPKVGDPVMAYRPMTSQEAQDPAIIGDPAYIEDPATGQPYTVYFTRVIDVTEDRIISVCDASSTSIQFLVNSTMLDSMLKTIREGSMGTSCLYVPSIGRLDDFDSDSIVHAAVGTQDIVSGVSHYYLTLKPIKYGEVTNPESTQDVDKSKLIIDYKDVSVNGNLLTSNLNVNNDAHITNMLRAKNIGVTGDLRVGTTNSRYTIIGGSTKDRIILYSNNSSLISTAKQTILTSESVTTDKVVAGNLQVNNGATISSGATINGKATINGESTAKVNGVPDVYLGCPVGTVVMWAGRMESDVPEGDLPEGWLFCNGDPIYLSGRQPIIPKNSHLVDIEDITRTMNIGGRTFNPITIKELQALVNVIGYRWDGDTTNHIVRLPNLQQRFPIGAKDDVFDGLVLELYADISTVLRHNGAVQKGVIYKISTLDKKTSYGRLSLKTAYNAASYIMVTTGGETGSSRFSVLRFDFSTIDSNLSISDIFDYEITTVSTDQPLLYTIDGGYRTSLAVHGGEDAHVLDILEMPSHNHRILHGSTVSSDLEGYGVATYCDNSEYENNNNRNNIYVDNTGGSEPHNNMPPYLAINFIIKYK